MAFLTMEPRQQPVATHSNASRLSELFQRLRFAGRLRPVATALLHKRSILKARGVQKFGLMRRRVRTRG
jgi:hypothetical protein